MDAARCGGCCAEPGELLPGWCLRCQPSGLPPNRPRPVLPPRAVETYASGAPKQRKRKAPVEEPAEEAEEEEPGAKKAKDNE